MSVIEELEASGEVLSPAVRAALTTLETRIGELEARLGQNSTNSSRPPSSDPPGTTRPKRTPRGGKRGGQKGHRGHHRSLLPEEALDEIVPLHPTACTHCGASLVAAEPEGLPIRHQVAELPPVRAHVTEYRLLRVRCASCGHTTAATPPAEVGRRHFGARLSAFVCLLAGRFHLSRRQSRALLEEVLEVPPSLGSVQALLEEGSRALAPAWREIRQQVRQSAVAYVDETSWRWRGRRAWVWGAVTSGATLFHIGRSRSARGRHRLLGHDFAGVLTSDRWSAYQGHPPERRQVCWAHLARDCIALEESGTEAAPLGAWAVHECVRLFRLWHRFQRGEIDRAALRQDVAPLRARFQRLRLRLSASSVRAASRLGNSLRTLWPALWSWSRVEGVEPTNNAAERALRKAVLWRKNSFGSGSFRGLRLAERLLSVSETCRQQHRSALDYLTRATVAFRSGAPAPLLLPDLTH
jgi:transposase